MIYIISLLIAAAVAMGVAVASVRRPLICCPAAGAAAGALLTVGGVLAVHGAYWWAVAAVWPGLITGTWGGWHALVSAARNRAAEDGRVRGPALAERRRDIGGHTITVEDGPDGRTVVERSDGWLMKVVRTERELAHGETVLMVARAAAWTYGAEYVSGLYGSASSARADLAVDNILGGGR